MGLLRVIFAISVVFAHSPWHDGVVLVGGQLAVQLFYVISGFLISHILTSSDRYKSRLKFYVSRWLRLYPLYYAVASLSLLADFVARRNFFSLYHSLPRSADILLVASNLLIFGQDWVMFLGISHGKLIPITRFAQSEFSLSSGLLVPQAWTLGVEMSFYAIAPFVLRSTKIIVSLLLLAILVRVFLLATGVGLQDPWTYRFFPAELLLFLLGALSQRYLLPCYRKHLSLGARARNLPAIAVAFLTLLSLIYFVIPVKPLVKGPIMLLAFVVLCPLTFIFQERFRWDRAFGQLSYPIYLGHMLTVWVAEYVLVRSHVTNTLVRSLINVILAIAFGWALNKLLGEPIERIRSKFKRSSGKQVAHLARTGTE